MFVYVYVMFIFAYFTRLVIIKWYNSYIQLPSNCPNIYKHAIKNLKNMYGLMLYR